MCKTKIKNMEQEMIGEIIDIEFEENAELALLIERVSKDSCSAFTSSHVLIDEKEKLLIS
jgi:hypothetical protein